MLQNKSINNRQKKLLSYLKSEYRVNPNRWVTQEDICSFIDEYEYNTDPYAHNHCTTIWSDVNTINQLEQFDNIVVYKDNNCKIATKNEAEEYLDTLMARALKKFKRYWTIRNKMENNGNVDMLSDVMKYIDVYGD